MKFARILFAASIGVALAAACGGSSTGPSGSAGGGGSSSSGAGSGSSSGSGSGGAGTGSGSGAGTSSGVLVTDSGAIAPTGVPCGNTANNLQIYCVGSQVCCTTIVPPEAGRGPALADQNCVADQSACPTGGIVMACMGSINCPDKMCCLEPGDGGAMGGGGVASSFCESACSATGVQICLTDTDCPTGQTCTGNRGGFTTCAVPPCTGPASCAAGQVCCTGVGGGGRANSCQATCPMGSMQVCAANADCPAGQTCNMAAGGGFGGMGGGNKTCGAPPCTAGSCGAGMVCCEGRAGGLAACAATGAMGCNVLCATAADCAAGQTCMAGAAAGAAMTCVTPPCTQTSCAAGEVCCTAGAGAACVATDAGTCPMGRLVCATAADCPAGDVCMAVGGGAILSCRPPMMMPPAMDAGARMTPMDASGGG
jgi:Cys-rich repeat protein